MRKTVGRAKWKESDWVYGGGDLHINTMPRGNAGHGVNIAFVIQNVTTSNVSQS